MQKITKILFFVIILLSVITLFGCTKSSTAKQLSTVDSLLAADKLTDAAKEVQKLKKVAMNESEQAKFHLLSLLTKWRLFQSINDTADLDESIAYYKQKGEENLLARCYYLKGELLSEHGNTNEKILFLKKAEQLVAKEDLITKHHIYESLSQINMHSGSLGLAIAYAQKALPIAQQLHKPDWEGYEYYLLILSYNSLGKKKEVNANMQSLLRLLPSMSEKGQMDVLEILGQYYQLRNPQWLERFMKKAMNHQGNITPYLFLAARRYNQGYKNEAYQLLNEAEKKPNGKKNYALIELRRDMKLNDQDYKTANLLSMQLVQLDDSILKDNNKKDMETVQNKFEQQLKEEKLQKIYVYAIASIIVLTLSIGLLIIIAVR